MTTFEIRGADRRSGVEQTMVVDAEDEGAAVKAAGESGMVIEWIKPTGTKLDLTDTGPQEHVGMLNYSTPYTPRRTWLGRLIRALQEDRKGSRAKEKIQEEVEGSTPSALDRIADDVAAIRFWLKFFGWIVTIGLFLTIALILFR